MNALDLEPVLYNRVTMSATCDKENIMARRRKARTSRNETAPSTIGKQVSSGCIRLTNEDVIDLYSRVQVGAKVIVLPQIASAKSRQTYAYAPPSQSRAQATWDTIRPSGRY